MFVWVILTFANFGLAVCGLWEELDLPREHLPFYFNGFPAMRQKCVEDETCPFKDVLKETDGKKKCWGYEMSCMNDESFTRPRCPGDHRGWVSSKEDQVKTFFNQGDFGYIREQLREMAVMCEPTFREDSSLECSKHLRFCRGRNVLLDFTGLANRTELIRYKMDVLSEGGVRGKCRLHKERLMEECDQVSPLQSWAPEMRFFEESSKPITTSDANDMCDVTIEKPTFILKIDAAVNMYHHFCDFFNLYASQHLNSTHPSAFSTDVHIIIWETYRYHSNFKETFDVFTRHPLWDLNTFRGRKVCFSNIVFPLLPRMIFGLYYNTPIIWGCQGSGLFRAFSEHVLHRLRVPLHPPRPPGSAKLRITLLSRESSFRNILNEDKLLDGLKRNQNYEVRRVVFSGQMPFRKQLEVTRNTDVFIGIHGAGLTHLLFLPDWAVVFELYNCQDESCYLDLARLRGVKYITWEKADTVHPEDEGHHPEGGAHAKFTNYKFDVEEFLRLVSQAEEHVVEHPAYQSFLSSAPVRDEL